MKYQSAVRPPKTYSFLVRRSKNVINMRQFSGFPPVHFRVAFEGRNRENSPNLHWVSLPTRFFSGGGSTAPREPFTTRHSDKPTWATEPSVQLDLESGTTSNGPQTAGLVTKPFQTVAEDVFIWALGPQLGVTAPDPLNCAEEILLLPNLIYLNPRRCSSSNYQLTITNHQLPRWPRNCQQVQTKQKQTHKV